MRIIRTTLQIDALGQLVKYLHSTNRRVPALRFVTKRTWLSRDPWFRVLTPNPRKNEYSPRMKGITVNRLIRNFPAHVAIIVASLLCLNSPAQTFTTLYSFDGTHGSEPYLMSLIQAADGALYGTAEFGGSHNSGTIFRITTAGALSTLHSFCSQANCVDGLQPETGLLLGPGRTVYGSTGQGGKGTCGLFNGCGTLFRFSSNGSLLDRSFRGLDGAVPTAALIRGTDGNFYGTTSAGGSDQSCDTGCGTIFKVSAAGALTKLHDFIYATDGALPYAPLLQGSDGNFYGATSSGGPGGFGLGTIFKLTPAGTLTTLYTFDTIHGGVPFGGLVEGKDGNFYGTTYSGGIHDCFNPCGTVFQITPAGSLTVLHKFILTDGGAPSAGLILASDGNFYGTTTIGGDVSCNAPYGCGTIFEITPAGTLTTLHSFSGTDGAYPTGGLIQANDGNFYGTTFEGGSNDLGTVYKLSLNPGAHP